MFRGETDQKRFEERTSRNQTVLELKTFPSPQVNGFGEPRNRQNSAG